METNTLEIGKQKSYAALFHCIDDFFDTRKVREHLIFLNYWMEKILINQKHKKYLTATDLVFFSSKFLKLITACYKLQSCKLKNELYIEETIKITEDFIDKEQKELSFYPHSLRLKEICNPMLVFDSIFKNHDLKFYEHKLQEWVNASLSNDYQIENVKLIYPTYTSLKKMVEACWLIHERCISKNSYQMLYLKQPVYDFALSCPLLLKDEYLSNPYLMVESFFSFASITEYREDLKQWFRAALNEHECYENASDLLFVHNQFLQLIQAAYLIGSLQLVYTPKSNYSAHHDTFGHWLLARQENDNLFNSIQTLSPHFRENPMKYCTQNLTLNHVIKIRYGLREWLEAALSKNNSINNLEHDYIFHQFEELQKILEALFLLIIQPSLINQSLSSSTN